MSERDAMGVATKVRLPWYRRRWVLGLLVAASAPLGLAGIGLLAMTDAARRAERSAVEEADRVDPRWRLADVEADREVVPDAENAATVVARAAGAMLPGRPFPRPRSSRPTPGQPTAFDEARLVAPSLPLGDDLFEALAGDLEADAPAIDIARGLAGMRRGRYPSGPRAFRFWTPTPRLDQVRTVSRLMVGEAMLRAHQGDGDAAILACRAALGAAASVGDEPALMAGLIRVGHDDMAVRALERTLGQGTATDAALESIDADLAAEDAQPLLRVALRGDRALEYETLGRVAGGAPPAALGLFSPGLLGGWGLRGPHIRAWFRYNQGRGLARHTAALAILDRPSHEQKPLWAAWEGEFLPEPRPGVVGILVDAPSRMMMYGGANVAPHFQNTQARLRAARVLIGMERFRLAHGRWPEADAEIPVDGGIPRDPFLDAPIRRKRVDGGWAIYSVGPDGVDDGGAFGRVQAATRVGDVGVTLFDPDHRRTPVAR